MVHFSRQRVSVRIYSIFILNYGSFAFKNIVYHVIYDYCNAYYWRGDRIYWVNWINRGLTRNLCPFVVTCGIHGYDYGFDGSLGFRCCGVMGHCVVDYREISMKHHCLFYKVNRIVDCQGKRVTLYDLPKQKFSNEIKKFIRILTREIVKCKLKYVFSGVSVIIFLIND